MSKRERRGAKPGLTLRESGTAGALPTLTGYAAVWDAPSELICGQFREFVRKGAFTRSLGRRDTVALAHHRTDWPLGRASSGTLKLSEDETGLAVEITPPDTSYARDLVASIRAGDVQGMSFGFETISDKWYMLDGVACRDLVEVELQEVSPVTFPAYEDTTIAVRGLTRFISHVNARNEMRLRLVTGI